MFVSILIISIIQLPAFFTKKDDFASPQNIYKFDIGRAFRQYGFIAYWHYQISYLKGCTAEEKKYAASLMREMQSAPPLNPLVGKHHKNLIVIIVESLATWPLNLSIEGVEVTPRMNALIKDSTTLFFPKVWPCRKDGRSADAQLLINTGLLPVANGATATLFGTNVFPSINKALRAEGYTSMLCITDHRSFWNQGTTAISYGFDKLYDQLGEDAPQYRRDENLFENGLNLITQLREPFHAQLVTISMHDAVAPDFASPLDKCALPNQKIKNHLILTNYTDRHIGRFLDDLKKCGLYDRSIIVIVSDHDAITQDVFDGRKDCRPEDRLIPLLILNSPIRTETDKVIAQVDIYPSLLDLMGVENYQFRGLGESIFRGQSNYACSHLGEMGEGGKTPSIRQRRNEMWKLSDILIRTNYFARPAK